MIDDTYEIKTLMGHGGSSRVLRWITRDGTNYAVKVIKNDKKVIVKPGNIKWISQKFDQGKVERMLFKEYTICEILKEHPNIVNCYESVIGGAMVIGQDVQPVHYNVLEACDNGALSRYVRYTGGFEENIARLIFTQLVSAVIHMHDRNIAHFDIKLENILLDEYYNSKIADFGSAELMHSKDSSYWYKKGTHSYMAPEVEACVGKKTPFSPFKADIYSLGVCLHLLLFGEFPVAETVNDAITFWSDDDMDTEHREKQFKNEEIFFKNTVSSDWADLLKSMIGKAPSGRASISQIAAHPWILQETCISHHEFYQEFDSRKQYIVALMADD